MFKRKKLTITFMGKVDKQLKETTFQVRKKDIKKGFIDNCEQNAIQSFRSYKNTGDLADAYTQTFKEFKKEQAKINRKALKSIEYVIVWEKKVFDTFKDVKEQGLYNYLIKL